MKRSFVLTLSMLFTATLAFVGDIDGRESPYYHRPANTENGVENEDHPWGGDGSGTNGNGGGKAGRQAMRSATLSPRFEIWLSNTLLNLLIAPKQPRVAPQPAPSDNSSVKNGGAN